MSAVTTFDMSEFQRMLNRHIALSSREMSKVINSRMYQVLIRALAHTPKADRGKIERYLGATTTQHTTRTGRVRNKLSLTPRPLAYAIVNARSIKAGKGNIPRDQVHEAARKFVARTMSSIGLVRAGWVAAIRRFAGMLGFTMKFEKLPRVKQSSTAKPATQGLSPVAEARYRLLLKQGQSTQGTFIHPSVNTAIDQAFREEYSEMAAHVQRKIEEINRKARRN